jgi:hypothetical protein
MIKFQQKIFAEDNEVIISQAGFLISELIKILMMGGRDIPHWLSNSLGAFDKAKTRFSDRMNRTALFLGIPEMTESISSRKINFARKELGNKVGLEYIKSRYEEVYNQKAGGSFKYRAHLKKNLTKDELEDLYIRIKYIALCVSGQLSPDTDGFYEVYNNISRTHINLKENTKETYKTY